MTVLVEIRMHMALLGMFEKIAMRSLKTDFLIMRNKQDIFQMNHVVKLYP